MCHLRPQMVGSNKTIIFQLFLACLFHKQQTALLLVPQNKHLRCLLHKQQAALWLGPPATNSFVVCATGNKQLCCLLHNQQATLLAVPPTTNSFVASLLLVPQTTNTFAACSTSNNQLCCLFQNQQAALLLVPQAAHAAWQSLAGLCGSYAEAMRKPSEAASRPVPGPAGQAGLGLASVGHPPFCNEMASLEGSLHVEPKLIKSL